MNHERPYMRPTHLHAEGGLQARQDARQRSVGARSGALGHGGGRGRPGAAGSGGGWGAGGPRRALRLRLHSDLPARMRVCRTGCQRLVLPSCAQKAR
jgi:hypothetical protein